MCGNHNVGGSTQLIEEFERMLRKTTAKKQIQNISLDASEYTVEGLSNLYSPLHTFFQYYK